MDNKHEVRRVLVSDMEGELQGDIFTVMANIQRIRSEYEDEYTRLEIETDPIDSEQVDWLLVGYRPETPYERTRREVDARFRARARKAKHEENERNLYERLKAKYEG